MTQELVVVHKRFVAAAPVTLQLKNNKAWIRSDVAVTDATTHKRCFKLKKNMWSRPGKRTLLDEQGHQIAAMKAGRSIIRSERFMKVSGEGFTFEVRCKA
jgi:hypothetical protein